jgi:hypothetical protein
MDSKVLENIESLVAKFDTMKKRDQMDLSSDQDLTIAIMNLISIEEHFFFTGAKTGNNEYYDLILEVRNMRKELLHTIITDYEGEVWCISKHLLAASYRLMEVGNKQLDLGNKEQSYELFNKAYKLYSLFWGLQMKLVPINTCKKIHAEHTNNNNNKNNDSLLAKLGSLVQKAINCCIE